MKIGVITDVHSNVFALKTVLGKLDEEGCEKIICCGDIIGIGPYPEETVSLIMETPNILAVCGNHERYLTEGFPKEMKGSELDHHIWEHDRLSRKSVEFICKLPNKINFNMKELLVLVIHYSMDENHKYINQISNPDFKCCRRMFSNVKGDVILYGHDHKLSINRDGNRIFANFGSLGCPGKDRNIARAGIIDIDDNCESLRSIKVPYDVEKVINDMDHLAYPASEEIKRFFFGMA